MALIPVFSEGWAAIIFLILNVFFISLTAPAIPGILSLFAGERQGMLMGLLSGSTNLARSTAPILMGVLYDLSSPVYSDSSGSASLPAWAFLAPFLFGAALKVGPPNYRLFL